MAGYRSNSQGYAQSRMGSYGGDNGDIEASRSNPEGLSMRQRGSKFRDVATDAMQGKPPMAEAFGKVRKYFGDRLSAMKENQNPTTGDGSVTNTALTNANPNIVKATNEGAQDGASIMETKMADYRSRDGGKGWDPSGEDWFDPSQAEQFGWVGGKWGDPVAQPAHNLQNSSGGGFGGFSNFLAGLKN